MNGGSEEDDHGNGTEQKEDSVTQTQTPVSPISVVPSKVVSPGDLPLEEKAIKLVVVGGFSAFSISLFFLTSFNEI